MHITHLHTHGTCRTYVITKPCLILVHFPTWDIQATSTKGLFILHTAQRVKSPTQHFHPGVCDVATPKSHIKKRSNLRFLHFRIKLFVTRYIFKRRNTLSVSGLVLKSNLSCHFWQGGEQLPTSTTFLLFQTLKTR